MSKVYLINIGANTADSSRARSPLFANGSFVYVPYSYKEKGTDGRAKYPATARPYIRNMQNRNTHNDPDWKNLTYGDICGRKSLRGLALRNVVENDILLFWSLLWSNSGNRWELFTGERRWCVIGALRVREILKPGQRPDEAKSTRRARAAQNVHFWSDALAPQNYVFIGCTKHSCQFTKAVDLQIGEKQGLLYQTIHSAGGIPLTLGGRPKWSSSTRACRAVWDLDNREDCARASIARKAIFQRTRYDLFSGLPSHSIHEKI